MTLYKFIEDFLEYEFPEKNFEQKQIAFQWLQQQNFPQDLSEDIVLDNYLRKCRKISQANAALTIRKHKEKRQKEINPNAKPKIINPPTLEQKLDRVTQEREEFRELYVQETAKLNQLQSKLKQINRDKEQLYSETNSLQSQVQILKVEKDKQGSEIITLRKSNGALQGWNERYRKEIDTIKSELELKIKEAQQLEQEKEASLTRLEELMKSFQKKPPIREIENNQKSQQLESALLNIQQEKNITPNNSKISLKLQQIETENLELLTQIKSLKNSQTSLKGWNTKYRNKIADIQQEMQRLIHESKNLEQDKEVAFNKFQGLVERLGEIESLVEIMDIETQKPFNLFNLFDFLNLFARVKEMLTKTLGEK